MPRTEYMDLQQLLSTYSPVYPDDFNWDSTLAYLQSSSADKRIVDQLSAVLLKGEKFRNPVILGLAESAEGLEFQAVTSGTHRVCAHILTGVVEISVRAEQVVSISPLPPIDFYSTDITFERGLTESQEDFLFDCLRSFPVNDTFWLTSDMSSTGGRFFTFMWDFEEGDQPIGLEEINSIVQGLLGLLIGFPKVTTVLTKIDTFDG